MPQRKLKNNKKGDLSMQMIAVMVLILATILVILGIFMNQTKDGSERLDNLKNSVYSDGKPCMGNGLSCKNDCGDDKNEVEGYSCSAVLGGSKCCGPKE